MRFEHGKAQDFLGRRITEQATISSLTTTTRWIYDGWNMLTEYTGTTLSKRYFWEMDLSGSMQGAGGVGGLLSVNDGTATYYPTYDGNGNVSEYLDSTGDVQAHYEYDPFGRTTVATGTKAQDFSHRFSTKPLDDETGLYYYGYRYYDPVTGRWPSRDPIGEREGLNLYGFVGNSPTHKIDVLGNSELALPASALAAPLVINPVGATVVLGAATIGASIVIGNELADRLIDEPSDIPADPAFTDRRNRVILMRSTCRQIHDQYSDENCLKCRNCMPCNEAWTNAACHLREIILRDNYLQNNCDYWPHGLSTLQAVSSEIEHLERLV
jgi:RHS repeat-associated protein